jgi:hypothetical protein
MQSCSPTAKRKRPENGGTTPDGHVGGADKAVAGRAAEHAVDDEELPAGVVVVDDDAKPENAEFQRLLRVPRCTAAPLRP